MCDLKKTCCTIMGQEYIISMYFDEIYAGLYKAMI